MARMLSPEQRIDWLQLARSGGIGPRTFFKLIQRFGSPRRALQELPRLAADGRLGDRFRPCRREQALAELEAIEAHGAQLIAHGEPLFPELLSRIADPPPVLTVHGQPGILSRPAVGLVGARNASANGRLLARRLAIELAEAGLVIASGLARGIDTAAHAGALEAGGPTVAVLACGINIAYPAENAALMAQIADSGAVISERPLGAEPQARHFPKRNRLIAGLSLGVVVVEAAPQSGSLITARLAAEEGREVMAMPGSPLDPRHRGTNQLLREGATLVECGADVLAALGIDRPVTPPRAATNRSARESRAALAPPPAPTAAAGPGGAVAARLCERLSPEPLLVDELIRQCDASSAEVQRVLLELELEGRIERHPGGRVSLAST